MKNESKGVHQLIQRNQECNSVRNNVCRRTRAHWSILNTFRSSASLKRTSCANAQENMDNTTAQVNDMVDEPPQDARDAVDVKKSPPPETAEHILRKRLIIASFWAVVLFLGLPIWWRTTTVYRANLPLQQMLDWADGKV